MLALFFPPLSVLGLRRLQAAAVFCGEKAGASPTWLQCAACFLRFPPPPFFLKFAPAQLLRPPSVTLSPSPSQAVVASVYIYCLFFFFSALLHVRLTLPSPQPTSLYHSFFHLSFCANQVLPPSSPSSSMCTSHTPP